VTTSPAGWSIAPLNRDLLLALLITALQLTGFEVSLTDDGLGLRDDARLQQHGKAGVSLLVLGTMALTFRQVAPVAVLVLNCTVCLAYQALAYRPPPLPLGVLVALFSVAVLRRPLICAGAAVLVLLAFSAGALSRVAPLTDDDSYTYLVSVVATVMVGYGVQLGRARATLAEQRAGELARAQDARTRAAVEQEQARIAREVHDIVAHDVSVIIAQAAAARRVFDRQPRTAWDALSSIEAVGRDALDGLRRLMGLLRTECGQEDRSPQPGLDRLPWLLAQVEGAGLPVELTICGQPRPLPATVELNAFRIVQEALTNSLKHAGPTRARVALRFDEESLAVEVCDEGRGGASDGAPGYGLLGMRQRVAMLGGELSAGPQAGAGFRVAAQLPVGSGTS
jgi:signal transduction histidine kinase